MARSRMQEVLRRVAARERLARLGVRSHRFLLVVAAAYLVLLLVSRLAGLLPDWFAPETILLAPAAAFALAFFTTRTPSETEAARLVDRRTRTDDLFLTAALLDPWPGRLYRSNYGPIVESDAEERAAGIRPADVVPFRLGPKARDASLALVVLLRHRCLKHADRYLGRIKSSHRCVVRTQQPPVESLRVVQHVERQMDTDEH